MTTPTIHYAETRYGFEYGSLSVERLASDDKKGWVIVSLSTAKVEVQVYATKAGRVHIQERTK